MLSHTQKVFMKRKEKVKHGFVCICLKAWHCRGSVEILWHKPSTLRVTKVSTVHICLVLVPPKAYEVLLAELAIVSLCLWIQHGFFSCEPLGVEMKTAPRLNVSEPNQTGLTSDEHMQRVHPHKPLQWKKIQQH